jgi:biofilm PGA synthesis N-glycosyltransferase PgaC
MTLVISIITIMYLLLIAGFIYGFDKVKKFKLANLQSKTRFSVIIPFRNEAENLPQLLESIQSLKYPKHLFEVIFINDLSEDDSVHIINSNLSNDPLNNIDFSIINNSIKTNAPKKDAISKAINLAKYEWIITTDADCLLPEYWLDSFDECIQKSNPKCVAAPVTYQVETSFLNRFQILDMLSLQGATIGGFGIKKPFLCNGANFAYQKEAFIEVNGFDGNTKIASGDDIFLLEKMVRQYPNEVQFLKSEQAIVITNSENSWQQLITQRIRWAAKTSSYNNGFGKVTGIIVLLMNLMVILSLLLSVLGLLKATILFYIVFIKFNMDVLLICKAAIFFNQKEVLRSILLGFLLYPFFSVYVAFLSLFKGYKWKDRSYKK